MIDRQVSVLIPFKGKKFLILRRAESSSWGGYWNFPGGSIEDREWPSQAAMRELNEEAGIDVTNPLYIYGKETEDKYIYFFVSNQFEGEVNINEESSDYKWISYNEIQDYKFIPLDSELLKNLKEYCDRQKD